MARQIGEVEGKAAEEATSHIFNTVNTNNIDNKKKNVAQGDVQMRFAIKL